MPISPSFSVAQSALLPASVVFVDTSAGTDPAISSRRIYVQQSNGDYVVPAGTLTDYIPWSYALSSLTVDLLTTDIACSVRVDWLDNTDAVLYTSENTFCFTQYSFIFFYYLIQLQADNPSIVQDTNYYTNLAMFWSNVQGAITAIQTGNDIAASQNCLNRATNLRLNQSINF